MDENKIAIVASEGGMSCAYSVGVILGLVEKYNLTTPDIVIGISGSTGTLAYYVAGQYKSIRNIWENLLSNNKFVNYSRLTRLMDIDYLIDEVFKKQDVLDISAVKLSPINFYIAVTNKKTGKTEYFSNKDDIDIFEALRASSAMPVFFNKSVIINSNEYIDGGVSSNIQNSINLAKHLGANKIVAIDNSNNNFQNKFFSRIYSLFTSTELRNAVKSNCHTLNKDSGVLLIKPSTKLPISTLDNNRDRIRQTIQIGYNDVVETTLIENFI